MKEITTIFFGFITGYIFAYVYEKIAFRIGKKLNKTQVVFLGYKLHHSIYGLLAIIIALFFLAHIMLATFLITFGLGIIIQHYFTGDGMVFITKHK
jgi:hypothetical protein